MIRHSPGLYFTMAAVFGIGVAGVLVGGVCAVLMREVGIAISAFVVALLGFAVVNGCIRRGRALRKAEESQG